MNDSHKCIYCPKEADSLEHVLPAAFGEFEGAPNLSNYLCQDCNRSLGLLDEQLSRCGPEALFRKFYGITGRSSHDLVNPFARGSAGGGRIEVTSWDQEVEAEVNLELIDGEARQLLEILFVEEASRKTHHLPLMEGMSADQLRNAFAKLGLSVPFETRISFHPHERVWAEPLIKEVWPTAEFSGGKLMSNTYSGVKAKFSVTDRYFRAIVKIGFHYFLSQFPRYSGHEAMFSRVRQFIFDDVKGPINRVSEFVRMRQFPAPEKTAEENSKPDAPQTAHSLGAYVHPGEMFAQVQILQTKDWPTCIYSVRLARYTSIIDNRSAAHGYRYFQDTKKGKFVGEAFPMKPVRSSR